MNMIEILQQRLPKGVTMASYQERQGGYTAYLELKGAKAKVNIPDTCAPGKENDVVDYAVTGTVAQLLFKLGNFAEATKWYAKQEALQKKVTG